MLTRSWRKFRGTIGENWPWLILDFVIVVAGVSLSFLVQDWRESRAEARSERRVLVSLRDDLERDQQLLEIWGQVIDSMVEAHDTILDPAVREAASAEELDLAIDMAQTYQTFDPTDGTWRNLDSSAGFDSEERRRILAGLRALYGSGGHAIATEWSQINGEFVRQRLIPWIEEHAPYVPPSADPNLPTPLSRVLPTLLENDTFLNLVRTGKGYRLAQRTVFEAVAMQTSAVVEMLDEEIGDR